MFLLQCYFSVPKGIRLNLTHYFILKIQNKRELQQFAFNHSSDIDFEAFMNLYKKFIEKIYSFLVIDTTVASDNSSRFRKNLLEITYDLIMAIDDEIKSETLPLILI